MNLQNEIVIRKYTILCSLFIVYFKCKVKKKKRKENTDWILTIFLNFTMRMLTSIKSAIIKESLHTDTVY